MEPKLTKEEADAMLAHVEQLFAKRLLTEDEINVFRNAIKYARRTVIIIRASPRFIISFVAFLAALGALKTYWVAILSFWPF